MMFAMQWVIFYVIASVLTIILSAIFIKKRKKKGKKRSTGEFHLINNIEKVSKKRKK